MSVNVLTSEEVGIGIGLLADEGAFVLVVSTVIAFGFVVSASSAVGELVDAWLDVLTAVPADDMAVVTAPVIGVGMLTDVDANVLVAVIVPALKFIVSAALADPVSFCCAASNFCPIADLDCT